MKILVTGAKGFIGKNLIFELRNRNFETILEFDIDTKIELLEKYCKECDFVFHLAGVNRPQNQEEYMTGNFGFTSTLLETLKKHHNTCPIMLSSSIQATMKNSYGESKKAGEDLLFDYSRLTGSKVYVYRLPNVFGKWCRPNYNSVVATFCYNIANGIPIVINDPNISINLVYIDDVVNELINCMSNPEICSSTFYSVPTTYDVTVGKIAEMIVFFKSTRNSLAIPDSSDAFEKKLYATYLTYLPSNALSYPLLMKTDSRGSFTELFKSNSCGQISINVTKPGITKGNHWHHTKNEKFLVVSGNAIIRFRQVDSASIFEYRVTSDTLEVVDIPPGYAHNIMNVGENNLVTIMWANECFDPENPDTFPLEV